MSKYLTGLYNGNNEAITLVNKETDDSSSLKPDSLTMLNLMIPECSDSDLPNYFAGSHVEIPTP